jgi:hypothetical protein
LSAEKANDQTARAGSFLYGCWRGPALFKERKLSILEKQANAFVGFVAKQIEK